MMITVGAVKPWNSRFAETPKESKQDWYPTYDTQEEIDECTSCPFKVCINCHDKRLMRRHPNRAAIILMLQNGSTVQECVKKYGASIRTVQNYLRHLKAGGWNGAD